MKSQKLLDAIGNIDDQLIEEASFLTLKPESRIHNKHSRISTINWRSYASLAAGLCVCIIGVWAITNVFSQNAQKAESPCEEAVVEDVVCEETAESEAPADAEVFPESEVSADAEASPEPEAAAEDDFSQTEEKTFSNQFIECYHLPDSVIEIHVTNESNAVSFTITDSTVIASICQLISDKESITQAYLAKIEADGEYETAPNNYTIEFKLNSDSEVSMTYQPALGVVYFEDFYLLSSEEVNQLNTILQIAD